MENAPFTMPAGMYKGQDVRTVQSRYLMWWATIPIVPQRHPELFREVMKVIHERTADPVAVHKEFTELIAEKFPEQ